MIQVSINKVELANIVKEAVAEEMAKSVKPTPEPEPKTLHSIRELSEFLGCSVVTAQRYKNEGRIPYSQVGRKVLFNTTDVLKAINKTGGRKNG